VLSNYKGYEIDCKKNNTGGIDISVSGGYGTYSYNWNTLNGGSLIATSEDQQNLAAGTYNLTVTYGGVCHNNYSFKLDEPPAIMLDSLVSKYTTSNVSCYGSQNGYININPNGSVAPYQYDWTATNGSSVIKTSQNQNNLSAGTYHLQITDDNNCKYDWDIVLAQPDSISIDLKTVDIKCNGDGNGRIEASVEGGTPQYSYLWSNGEKTSAITNVSISDYYVTITDANQCSKIKIANVMAPDPLDIEVHKSDISCKGNLDGSISLKINGGRDPYTFAWSNGASTSEITGLTSDTYSVKVTDWGGCVGNETISIIEPDTLQVTFTKEDLLCNNQDKGKIELNPTGGATPYYYMWSQGFIGKKAEHLPAGTYFVIVRDNNNCPYNLSITLTQPEAITIEKEITKPYCPDTEDGSILINAGGGIPPLNYSWNNGSNVSNLEYISAGRFIVTVSDFNNCQLKDTIFLTPDKSGCVDVPSAFSPNGDGVNETWDIFAGSSSQAGLKVRDLYPEAVMEIYNRWGMLIFKSEPGYTKDWDGTFKDKKLPVDSYYYIFDLRNGSKPLTGSVTIIR